MIGFSDLNNEPCERMEKCLEDQGKYVQNFVASNHYALLFQKLLIKVTLCVAPEFIMKQIATPASEKPHM